MTAATQLYPSGIRTGGHEPLLLRARTQAVVGAADHEQGCGVRGQRRMPRRTARRPVELRQGGDARGPAGHALDERCVQRTPALDWKVQRRQTPQHGPTCALLPPHALGPPTPSRTTARRLGVAGDQRQTLDTSGCAAQELQRQQSAQRKAGQTEPRRQRAQQCLGPGADVALAVDRIAQAVQIRTPHLRSGSQGTALVPEQGRIAERAGDQHQAGPSRVCRIRRPPVGRMDHTTGSAPGLRVTPRCRAQRRPRSPVAAHRWRPLPRSNQWARSGWILRPMRAPADRRSPLSAFTATSCRPTCTVTRVLSPSSSQV